MTPFVNTDNGGTYPYSQRKIGRWGVGGGGRSREATKLATNYSLLSARREEGLAGQTSDYIPTVWRSQGDLSHDQA